MGSVRWMMEMAFLVWVDRIEANGEARVRRQKLIGWVPCIELVK